MALDILSQLGALLGGGAPPAPGGGMPPQLGALMQMFGGGGGGAPPMGPPTAALGGAQGIDEYTGMNLSDEAGPPPHMLDTNNHRVGTTARTQPSEEDYQAERLQNTYGAETGPMGRPTKLYQREDGGPPKPSDEEEIDQMHKDAGLSDEYQWEGDEESGPTPADLKYMRQNPTDGVLEDFEKHFGYPPDAGAEEEPEAEE